MKTSSDLKTIPSTEAGVDSADNRQMANTPETGLETETMRENGDRLTDKPDSDTPKTDTSPKEQSKKSSRRPRYHHGDLKQALLKAAEELLIEKGSDGLTMRDLSKRIGVSRTAAYHHFKDRADLLAAIAGQGLTELFEQGQAIMDDEELTTNEKFKKLMFNYVNYATQHPQKYDLMVGNDLWTQHDVPQLHELARHAFRTYVGWISIFAEKNVIRSEDPLRTAQLTWATLHGLSRLMTDGIFARHSDMEEIMEYGINLFTEQTEL